MDFSIVDRQYYLNCHKFPYYIISKIDYVAWVINTRWRDIVIALKCMLLCCSPTLFPNARWCYPFCAWLRALVKNCSCLKKQANFLKLFAAFEPLGFVFSNTLVLPTKSLQSFQCSIVVMRQFIEKVRNVWVKYFCLVNVAQTILKTCLYEYKLAHTLLSDNGKQFTFSRFCSVWMLHETTNAFTSTYHPHISRLKRRYIQTQIAILYC